jgi:DNA mismatch repair protein MutS
MGAAARSPAFKSRNARKPVGFFVENREFAEKLEPHIRHIGDLERLMSKTAVGKINPREVMQLRRALMAIGQIDGPSPEGEGGSTAASGKNFLKIQIFRC